MERYGRVVSIRMKEPELKKLDVLAKETDRTYGGVIRQLVKQAEFLGTPDIQVKEIHIEER